MAGSRKADPRESILGAASELFGRHGFQAVGVDRIAEESGVAKMTLYRAFSSKDDLIAAYLDLEHDRLWQWLRSTTADLDDPAARLRAFYEALAVRTASAACTGCPFQIAASEFPDPRHPANRRARSHKRGLRAQLEQWAHSAGLADAERMANQLFLLMEGAWAAARMHLDDGPGSSAAAAAMLLIEGARFVQAAAALPDAPGRSPAAGSSAAASTKRDL
jgi:AcrR family transcriptional regulator